MIETESEYRRTKLRLDEGRRRLGEQEKRLVEMGLSRDELKRALDPIRSFHLQLAEEVGIYEQLMQGESAENK